MSEDEVLKRRRCGRASPSPRTTGSASSCMQAS